MYRTHTCGCLRACNVNQTVTLAGWVQKVRNLGAMTFIDLRDRYGITQIVVEEHSPAEDAAHDRRFRMEDRLGITSVTLLGIVGTPHHTPYLCPADGSGAHNARLDGDI